MGKKAIVAGHICLDITPVFPSGAGKVRDAGELLRPGKLIEVQAPDVHTGGAVANTGLGMKVLGADVKLLGKVGNDAFGVMIRQILDAHGAGGDLIEAESETSSYSVVLAVPGVDRMFLHCPGANDTFVSGDIPEEALKDAALFHFGYPTLMRSMYEDDGAELIRMFREMKTRGIATSLDLAMADPMSDAGRADWKKILAGVLPYVDFFVPSFEELCFMLEPERYEALLERAEGGDITGVLNLEEDIRPLAEACIGMGAKAVLLKCGAPGMYLKTSAQMNEVGNRLVLDAERWTTADIFERSFRIDKVLSGTGAGDTSIAAFLTGVLAGLGPKESVELAAAEGALCCTAYDAISGLRPLEEVRERIEAGWEKRSDM